MEVVRAHFRPEFLNRLDEIVLFNRLAQQHMSGIVDIQVARVQKLLADRKVTLDLTDAARAWLGRVGYDPVYGARPLQRSEEHTTELQSLMRNSYAVFCFKKKKIVYKTDRQVRDTTQ